MLAISNLLRHLQTVSRTSTGSLLSLRTVRRATMLSSFVSVQLMVQVLSAVSGIIIIRSLDPTQYAYFTIANSMQATMNMLADLGIGTGLMAIGGKVWQDRYRLGQLINTALILRRTLLIGVVALMIPLTFWLLFRNGASWNYSLILTLFVIIELNFRIVYGVYHVVLRLHSRVARIQTLDFAFASLRLLLIGVAYLVYLNAAIAVLASLIATVLQRWLLGNSVQVEIEKDAAPNADDRHQIIRLIKSQAAYFVFYCIQGQLTILVISVFGNTRGIAEVGALSRLGLLLAVIGSVVNSIIAPSFARSQSKKKLQHIYFQTVAIFGVLAVLLVVSSILFPNALLWILGHNYAHLENEVKWAVAGSMTTTLAAIVWSLNTAKGWVDRSWLIIPTTIAVQVVLLLMVDVSLTRDVMIFNFVSSLPTVFVNLYLTYRGLLHYDELSN